MKLSGKIKTARRRILSDASHPVFDLYTNLKFKINGYYPRIKSESSSKFIKVSDKYNYIYICRRDRASLYKRGIEKRIIKLSESYLLHHIAEPLSGAFIDCGANVGELGAFCKKKGFDYHAFEPEKLEADCCDLNNFDGVPLTNRVGLWSEDGVLNFYSKPNSADSSLFETDEYVECYTINVRSLDSYIAENNIQEIAIIKIEAEGAEPEILSGARESLKLSRYVTVDCGFERGKTKDSTLIPVINILMQSGFEAVAWNRDRVTVLFKNLAILKAKDELIPHKSRQCVPPRRLAGSET
ncbi:FkbM family methyltransferase [Mesorhizobium sp. CN5-321]|jgi:FkbM family methyltransferase|uniref:FkbM family methyltransferase n=1 Tax=Mesorhizobium hunchu TaxID=3157708 RepID=UPI0032B853C8